MGAQYLTNQDVQDYGTDLISVTQRAALEVVAPHLQNLEQQNVHLHNQLAQESRRSLDLRVAALVPDYQNIDRDERWHSWLRGVDSLSGQPRQTLLNIAIADRDASRIANFFRKFLNEAASAQPPATYGRAMPSGQIYTRQQITRLYEQHRRGAYRGRESAWAAQENDIVAAAREGRVRGDYITK